MTSDKGVFRSIKHLPAHFLVFHSSVSPNTHLGLREEAPRKECQLEGKVERDLEEEHRQERLQNAERREHNPVRKPAAREIKRHDENLVSSAAKTVPPIEGTQHVANTMHKTRMTPLQAVSALDFVASINLACQAFFLTFCFF